ncbi:MAG: VanW family protein [Alphaproteobacteria bacterium]|nr:VanW family protein [Alphaproteobacteria bacterium]
MKPLVPRPPGPLHRKAREVVPFAVRSGVFRLPHVLRWLRDRGGPERAEPVGVVVCERSSPMRRPGTTYAEALQAAKEANVARVARALHGVRVPPGGVLSWHATIGPPLRFRGFAPGPELHDGVLATGAGGGACQVANLLFWLGAHAGMEVVERHRHGLDLFPDDRRDVPFGCGATVFYPHSDLVLANPHGTGLRFAFVRDGADIVGRVLAEDPLPRTYRLEERDHRFFRRDGEVWRANAIHRVATDASGATTDTLLVDNLARVTYPVPSERLEAP